MVKTLEQLREEARILAQAKRGMAQERKSQRIDKTKKTIKKLSSTGSKIIKDVSKGKVAKKNLSSNLLRTFGGGTSQKQGNNPVGRPRGDFKHRDPFTGKPLPATIYYRRMRDFKRMQQQKAQEIARQVDAQQLKQYAKRGIAPEEAKQIVDRRQVQNITQPQQYRQPIQNQNIVLPDGRVVSQEQFRQLIMQQQIQQQNMRNPYNQQLNPQDQMQQGQVIPRGTPVWKFRRGVVGKDAGLFGPRRVVFGLPESFWN